MERKIHNLDDLRRKLIQTEDVMQKWKKGLEQQIKKLEQYDELIKTNDGTYDIDALVGERVRIKEGVIKWEEGLLEQKQKQRQYQKFIEEAEGILQLHGITDGSSK